MKKQFINRILSTIVIVPLSLFFIIEGSLLFNLFISICFLVAISEWYSMSKKKILFIIGLIFLLISFYTAISIRNGPFDDSPFTFLFVLTVCVFTDIGGYIFGNFFKGPKLISISPNKTYSGMFGGFLLSLISSFFLVEYLYLLNSFYEKKTFNLNLFFISFTISAISQIGDIIVSYFKRIAKIKNTGNLIPGHGGILDRIDGMIFAFPFYYLILIFIN